MRENLWLAFLLTAMAGCSTGIGSLIAFFTKKKNTKFLSISLGFSAGVMIYVSMIEMFSLANTSLSDVLGARRGTLFTIAGFFGGMFLIAIIDRLIPFRDNPHEMAKTHLPQPALPMTAGLNQYSNEECVHRDKPDVHKKLLRSGMLTAVAITIHNFPEGIATFVSALQAPNVAVPIVAAIAIHNIPEGIATALPIYFATGSKKKAFFFSSLSGLSEPFGAIIGYFILMPFLNDIVYGVIFAAVAGIMVFVSFDELLPTAREYGAHHLSIYGLIAGMIIMAVSLVLFI